jgi:hypothetical protein
LRSVRGVVAAVAGLADGVDVGAAGLPGEYMSASLPCMSWNSPIAWPNCLRSCTKGSTTSMQAAMMPSGPPESTARS